MLFSKRTNKKVCAREVIQIGAGLLNEALEIVGKFSTYVEPQLGWSDEMFAKMEKEAELILNPFIEVFC